jgi:hypothetical protein
VLSKSLTLIALEGIASGIATAWRESSLNATVLSIGNTARVTVATSTVATGIHQFPRKFQNPFEGAVVARLVTVLLTWIQTAWVYRWLTAEQEPEVIVIDLRETLSVGPVIAAMDRTLRWLVPAAATAAVVRLTARLATMARRRPIRLGSLCLGLVVAVGVTHLALVGRLNEITLALALALGALAIAGLRSRASLEDVQNHPVTRALISALEPPEPPESD